MKNYKIGDRVKFRVFGGIFEGTITGKDGRKDELTEAAGGFYSIRFADKIHYRYGIDLNPEYDITK